MADFTSGAPSLATDIAWNAAGDIVYATADDTAAILSIGCTNEVLLVSCGLPSWGCAPSASVNNGDWCGTDLSVANGGTGLSCLTTGSILIGTGSSDVTLVAMVTKGHLLGGDGSGAPRALAVGSNCQVLTACSGEDTGMKWACAAGGGITINCNTNNLVLTATGTANCVQGESALAFTGTNLGIGVTDPDQFLEIKGGNNAYVNINHTGGAGGYQSGVLFKTSDTQNYKIDVTGNGDMTWRAGAGETVAMTLDADGILTKPLQPAFQVYPTGDSCNSNATGNNTTQTYVFGSERFDVGCNFISNAFTAPVTGKYQLNMFLMFEGIAPEHTAMDAHIVTGNKTYVSYHNPYSLWNGTSGVGNVSRSVVADMDAGDTAYINWLAGPSGQVQSVDGNANAMFSGILIG